MTDSPRRRHFFPLVGLMMLAACSSVPGLLFEPAPSDPNDGYEGSLAQAGVNTEMDWGPKQNLLLSQYKMLLEEKTQLQKRLDTVSAENQNLKTQLNGEQTAFQSEQALRAQLEAQLELRAQKLGEQEAIILSLRIEKAKAEQAALLAKIDALQATMTEISPSNVEAAAMPPANR